MQLPLSAIASIIIAPLVHCLEESFQIDDGSPNPLPNVGWLLYGYNIFNGNPQSTEPGVDPGFTSATAVYQAVYSGQTTSDGRYQLPDNTNIMNDYGCALSFASKVTFRKSDYTESLKVSVKANFEGFGASFSSSVDYTSFDKYTSSDNVKMVSSVAECAVYSGGIDAYMPPNFTNNFRKAIDQLPSEYGNGEQLFDFIDSFGTHIVKQMTMGARFGFTSFLDEQASSKIEQTGVKVDIAAQYEGIVKAGGSISDESSKQAQQEFSATSQHERLITLGTRPTTTDAIKWANDVIGEPMPIKYKLGKICEILEDARIREHCNTALTGAEYCTKRLLARGQLKSCDAPHDSDIACLWDTDCGQGEQCSHNQCVAKPMPWKEIHSNDVVHLKHVASQQYFKDVAAAGTRKGWPHGRLGSPKGEFRLLFKTPTDPIRAGVDTLLRVQSLSSTDVGYDFMYEGSAGGIYFAQNHADNDKQWWRLTKVQQGAGDDEILRDGDTVRFENKYHAENFLQKYEDDWVYSLEGEDNWIIRLSEQARQPLAMLV